MVVGIIMLEVVVVVGVVVLVVCIVLVGGWCGWAVNIDTLAWLISPLSLWSPGSCMHMRIGSRTGGGSDYHCMNLGAGMANISIVDGTCGHIPLLH